jgi:hypothetical protein
VRCSFAVGLASPVVAVVAVVGTGTVSPLVLMSPSVLAPISVGVTRVV